MRSSLLSEDERLEAMASSRSTSLMRAQSQKMTPTERTRTKDIDKSMLWESLDCDRVFTPDFVDKCRKKKGVYFDENNQIVFASKSVYAASMTLVMGMAIATAAFIIQTSSNELGKLRNQALQVMLTEDWSTWRMYLYFASFNLGCVLLAGILTLIEPTAEDDGIGEIKGYLNGVCLRRLFSANTLLVKVVGAILGTAGCLVSGAEASMVHIGAGLASGVTRGNRLRQHFVQFCPSVLGIFHNDRDRKDFVCAGAGAGMAAAFGAPVGGMLFAMEGTSSHWNHNLIWRIFTAALTATIFLDIVRAGWDGGNISVGGLMDLGVRDSRDTVSVSDAMNSGTYDAPILYWEMLCFILVGVLGGLAATILKAGYRIMSHLRAGESRLLRLLEVSILSIVTSSIIFYLSWSFPQCRNAGSWTCSNQQRFGAWCGGPSDNTTCLATLGQCDSAGNCPIGGGTCVNGTCVEGASSCFNATGWTCVGGSFAHMPCRPHATECEWQGGVCTPFAEAQPFGVQMNCQVGQYDELATFFFERREWSVRKLVTQSHPHEPFTHFSMAVAASVYLLLLIFTFGAPIPAGLFMPCIVVGSCIGRIVGQLVKQYISDSVFAGSYSLAGAAAMLGGVQATSISMVVVMLESTSNAHFLIPIVVAGLAAKLTSAYLGGEEDIYDIVMKRKRMTQLKSDMPWEMRMLTAADVMTRPPTNLRVIERVGTIVDILRSCSHNGFPVVTGVMGSDGGDLLEGLVLRSQLRSLLSLRFMPDEKGRGTCLWLQVTTASNADPPLDGHPEMYEILDSKRFAGSSSCQGEKEWEWGMFLEEDRARLVNLGPYMNCSPPAVSVATPLDKCYSLFTKLGLRHLPVVSISNSVVGIITRSNLTGAAARRAVNNFYSYEEMHELPTRAGDNPRLRGAEQVAKARARERVPLDHAGEGKYIGGELSTWQTRLAGFLRVAGDEA